MIIELVIQNWIDFGVLTAIQFGNATLGWYAGVGCMQGLGCIGCAHGAHVSLFCLTSLWGCTFQRISPTLSTPTLFTP